MDNQHNRLMETGRYNQENLHSNGEGVKVNNPERFRVSIFSKNKPLTETERAEMALRGQVGKVGIRVSNDKHGFFGGRKQNAKDLTAEIDRATDIELKAGTNFVAEQDRPQENFVVSSQNVNKNNVQPNYVNNNFNHEGIKRAEAELKRDRMESDGELAGVETKVETEEYLQTDKDLSRAEEGFGWEGKILKESNGRITADAVKGIKTALREESSPLKMEEMRHRLMLEALGRQFGRAS